MTKQSRRNFLKAVGTGIFVLPAATAITMSSADAITTVDQNLDNDVWRKSYQRHVIKVRYHIPKRLYEGIIKELHNKEDSDYINAYFYRLLLGIIPAQHEIIAYDFVPNINYMDDMVLTIVMCTIYGGESFGKFVTRVQMSSSKSIIVMPNCDTYRIQLLDGADEYNPQPPKGVYCDFTALNTYNLL